MEEKVITEEAGSAVDDAISFIDTIDMDMLTAYAIEYGTALIGAILIFIIGKMIARYITKLTRKMMTKNNLDPTIVSFLSNIIYAMLFAMVVIAAISTLGVETTSLAAIIAAAGLAIGLALQGSLSNFAAGVLVIIFRPLKVGDFVEAGGATGVVEEVNIFTTHLKTTDNVAVVVPNSQITGGIIKNYSAKATRRIDLVVGVGYGDDLHKTKSVLEDIMAKNPRILKDPAPRVEVSELGDSSVNFVFRPWVKSEDYWDVRFELMMEIKNRLDNEGISIPFPQRDLHIISDSKLEVKKSA